MKNVLVTNGNVRAEVLKTFLPYIDAMNVDLKCFSEKAYREVLSGDLPTVKEFIRLAAEAEHCHVELTTLIVPGMNDAEEEMREACRWIASLAGGAGREIPLHVTRFFPRFRMSGGRPTPVRTVYRLADVARETLEYVYTGNC
jgi:pyruvate formate lyase activating enzyme